ncbi:MAG: DUF3616 domain-containing protein [Pedosphaera sp.]|nr:DUF3616 domain-containing protein [Pedosphaera sp.]
MITNPSSLTEQTTFHRLAIEAWRWRLRWAILMLSASTASGRGRTEVTATELLRHAGMANASAAASLSANLFVVASDEDNRLRIYSSGSNGAPVFVRDCGPFLGLTGHALEADIEGGARVGDRIFWLGSHSRNQEGRWRGNRHRFFATDVITNANGFNVIPAGQPCTDLLEQILADPRFDHLDLKAAALNAPERGGINLEGLAATSTGGLLLGFRSPAPEGHALLIPLINPADVVVGRPARFADAIRLNLEGLGVRDIVWTGSEYYVIAGSQGKGGVVGLYRWKGPQHRPKKLDWRPPHHFNAEALAVFGSPEHPTLLVLSDDGRAMKSTGESSFRSLRMVP